MLTESRLYTAGRAAPPRSRSALIQDMKRLNFVLLFLSLCLHVSAGEISLDKLKKLTQIQCGNLMYGGTQTSVCFADHFLTCAAKDTNLSIAPNFTPVQLSADAVFNTPFCV